MTHYDRLIEELRPVVDDFIEAERDSAGAALRTELAAVVAQRDALAGQVATLTGQRDALQLEKIALLQDVSRLQAEVDRLTALVNDSHAYDVDPATQDLVSVLSTWPAGKLCVVGPGEARVDRIWPAVKNGMKILFRDTHIVGSRKLLGWTAIAPGADVWVHAGDLPTPYTADTVAPPEWTTGKHAFANQKREDLFVDGQRLDRVMRLDALTPGTFYQDYAANKQYVCTLQAPASAEMCSTRSFIHGNAVGLEITGGTFRGFAAPVQLGSLVLAGSGIKLTDVTFEDNHCTGLHLTQAHGAQIVRPVARRNGQEGITCHYSDNVTFRGVEIVENSTTFGRWDDWEYGGIKITKSVGVKVLGGVVSRNRGVGMWSDVEDWEIEVAGLTVEGNASCGIRHEIGGSGHFHHNRIVDNGLEHRVNAGSPHVAANDSGMLATAGLMVSSSAGKILIEHNYVVGNRHGIGIQQRNRARLGTLRFPDRPWVLQDVLVRNNTIASRPWDADWYRTKDAQGNTVFLPIAPDGGCSGLIGLGQDNARAVEMTAQVIFRDNLVAPTERIYTWNGTRWAHGALAAAQAKQLWVGSTLWTVPV